MKTKGETTTPQRNTKEVLARYDWCYLCGGRGVTWAHLPESLDTLISPLRSVPVSLYRQHRIRPLLLSTPGPPTLAGNTLQRAMMDWQCNTMPGRIFNLGTHQLDCVRTVGRLCACKLTVCACVCLYVRILSDTLASQYRHTRDKSRTTR